MDRGGPDTIACKGLGPPEPRGAFCCSIAELPVWLLLKKKGLGVCVCTCAHVSVYTCMYVHVHVHTCVLVEGGYAQEEAECSG